MLLAPPSNPSSQASATAAALVRMYEIQRRDDLANGYYLSARNVPANDIPVITASATLPSADADAATNYRSLIGRSANTTTMFDITFGSELDSLESWIAGFNRGLLCRWRYDMYRVANVATGYIGNAGNGNQDNNGNPLIPIASNGVYSDFILDGDVLFITGTNSSRFSIWVNDRLLTTASMPAGTGITADANGQVYYPSNSSRQYIKLKFPTVDSRAIRIFHSGGGGIGDFYTRITHGVRPRFRRRLNWLHIGDGHSSLVGAYSQIQGSSMHMASAFGPSVNFVNAALTTSGWALNTPGTTPNWLERWDIDLKRNKPMDVVTLFGSYGDGSKPDLTKNIAALIGKIKEAWPACEIIVSQTVISTQVGQGFDIPEERLLLATAEAAGASIVRVQTDPAGRWLTGSGSTGTPAGNGNADIYGSGSTLSAAGHVYFGRRWANGVYEAMRNKIGA